jgi:hypothetical protein
MTHVDGNDGRLIILLAFEIFLLPFSSSGSLQGK